MSDLREIRTTVDPSKFKLGRWANDDELDILANLIKEGNYKYYIECGTANGNSAANAKEAMGEGGIVHTWDVVERPIIPSHHVNSTDFHRHVISFEIGVNEIIAKINVPKFVFIDGNHEGLAPTKDFEAVEYFLKPGDMVAFHDTLGEAPCYRAAHKVETKYPNWIRKDFATKRGIAVFYVL